MSQLSADFHNMFMMLGVYNSMFSVAVGVENTQAGEERHPPTVSDLSKTHFTQTSRHETVGPKLFLINVFFFSFSFFPVQSA